MNKMDYKYIEQLLEHYWEAQTNLEEESILRSFFNQENVPTHLRKYQALFVFQKKQQDLTLNEDFDARILQKIGELEPTKAPTARVKRLGVFHRLQPLFRAVAVVTFIVLIGATAQKILQYTPHKQTWDYNTAGYVDTYQQPKDAYKVGMAGIQEISEMLQGNAEKADTLEQQSKTQK